MNPNLWQYLVLLEGLGAVATAIGVAQESLRRDPLKILGYANVGVALICVSACVNLIANLSGHPTLSTWISAVGFGLYGVCTVSQWARGLPELLRYRPHAGTRAHL